MFRIYRIAFRGATKSYSVIVGTPMRYARHHFRDWHGAASLRYKNHAEITSLMCEQKPYGFFVGANQLVVTSSVNKA